MSTKSTIGFSHGPDFDFHFYHEALDDDSVYLELRGPNLEYEAHADRVQVRIPVEIWEVIRHHAPPDLRFADWTDSQVDAYVENEVERRIQEHCEHRSRASGSPSLRVVFAGSLLDFLSWPCRSAGSNHREGIYSCMQNRTVMWPTGPTRASHSLRFGSVTGVAGERHSPGRTACAETGDLPSR